MVREERDRKSNTIYEAVRGINNMINDIIKDLDMARDKLVMDGETLASTEVEGPRIASEIDRVKEQSKEGKTDRRASVNRNKAM